MAEYNLTPARQVIIHGDCWQVVSAVHFVAKAMRPECRCDVADSLPCLFQGGSDKSEFFYKNVAIQGKRDLLTLICRNYIYKPCCWCGLSSH